MDHTANCCPCVDHPEFPMGSHINDMCTSEVMDELIQRLILTNGIDFCSPEQINKLKELLA